jgi:hypothetical protein
MAYVLSNYYTGSYSAQHLFKFDPLNFSSTAIWIKKTLGTSGWGHLGLIFGRGENLLYAFSKYNGYGVVTLIDTNGNPQWQYYTIDGNYDSNSIAFKEIDASTDMIIATSGNSYINYNRILSSSLSSYPVSSTDSKAFRDPNSRSYWSSRGIYIIDKDNAKCLVFDSYYWYLYLASIFIDFLQKSIYII